MRRETWIAGTVVVAAVVATGVVLFSQPKAEVRIEAGEMAVATPEGGVRHLTAREVASLLAQKDELEDRVAELEKEVAAIRAEAAAQEAARTAVAEGAPEPEAATPAGVPKSVAETDWDKLGLAVARLVAAESEGKDPTSDPVLMIQMAYLLSRLRAIAGELGVEDPNDVFYHPKVTARFMDGMTRALFPGMDEEARAGLAADLGGVVERESLRWRSPLLPIEKQLRDLELALKMVEEVRGTLSADQVDRLLRVVGADRPGGYSISWMAMTEVEGLRAAMGDVFSTRLGLTGREDEIARGLGAAFVDRHLTARADLARDLGEKKVAAAMGARIGTDETPIAKTTAMERTRVRAALARVQAESERALYEQLPPELRKKMIELPVSLWIVSLTEGD